MDEPDFWRRSIYTGSLLTLKRSNTMQVSGISSLLVIVGFIPCVVLPLLVIGYLFIRERRK